MDFAGRTAVVTGASTGMGRYLAVLLSRRGCNVAACDVRLEELEETREMCSGDVNVTVHLCDVADDAAVERLREEVEAAHGRTTALLFNNAGIAGAMGSFLDTPKATWDKAFNVNLHGVVAMTRAFLPTIVKQEKGYVVNTSSVNGFWAAIGPPGSKLHNSYATSKFAVRGFSESLMMDLRTNHPHVGVAVVHPGHVGTKIATNSAQDGMASKMSTSDMKRVQALGKWMGRDFSKLSEAELALAMGEMFEDRAPVTAEQAAEMIISGVASGSTRILIGEDARVIDWMVRMFPRAVYTTPGFYFMALWMFGASKIGAPGGLPLGRFWLPGAVVAGGAVAARVGAQRALSARLRAKL